MEEMEGEGGNRIRPGMSSETTRNYVRRSLGGDNPQNREGEMINAAAAQQNQQMGEM